MRKLPSPKVVEFQSPPFFVKLGTQTKLTAEAIKINKFEFYMDDSYLYIKQGDLAWYVMSGTNLKFATIEGNFELPQGINLEKYSAPQPKGR